LRQQPLYGPPNDFLSKYFKKNTVVVAEPKRILVIEATRQQNLGSEPAGSGLKTEFDDSGALSQ
jgi:hypothetical protein